MGIFDSGGADRHQARLAALAAQLVGGQFGGPLGIGAGFNVGPQGTIGLSSNLGAFGPIAQNLLAGGPSFSPVDFSGIDRLAGVAGDIPDFEGGLNLQTTGGAQRTGLSNLFQSALGTATADPFDLGAGVADKLRPGLGRAQNRLRNTTFDELFKTGGAAVSGVASPVLEGLQKQFAEQNQALDVTGLNIGQDLQQNAVGRLFGAQQGIAGIDAANAARLAQNFGADLQGFQANLGGRQTVADIFRSVAGMGLQGQETDLRRQMAEFGGGLEQVGTAANLAQLPLAFQNALLGFQGLKSDVDLGRAGIHSNLSINRGPSATLRFLDFARGFFGQGGPFSEGGAFS